MDDQSILLTPLIVFAGAAIFSTVALYLQQSLLVAYVLLGMLLGPWSMKIIPDFAAIGKLDDIGSIFFMFLVGLQLRPRGLLRMLSKTIWPTVVSSMIFFIVAFSIGYYSHYSMFENIVIGFCATFSSTLLGAKFLPPALGKHRYTGEVVLSILLLQDLIATLVLLFIGITNNGSTHVVRIMLTLLAIPGILIITIFGEKFILKKLLTKFSNHREYILLLSVAWCLGIAQLAHIVGLPYEVGAFISGITLVINQHNDHVYAQIQPIRDFFLVFFFFDIGRNFNIQNLEIIVIPLILLTSSLIILKPLVFRFLLRRITEVKHSAGEIGVRLGQLSEFSIFVIFAASRSALVSPAVVNLIQNVTVLMFIASSFLVVTINKRQLVQNSRDNRITIANEHYEKH